MLQSRDYKRQKLGHIERPRDKEVYQGCHPGTRCEWLKYVEIKEERATGVSYLPEMLFFNISSPSPNIYL